MNDNSRPQENQPEENSVSPLLPRSPWKSQVAFLKALFRAKKALDRIEKEAGCLISD
ncbi:MAG: hypothetical protein VKL59_09020 [Nostocaceae cyanobacterium]|nr:hypothetical protein [Nostocaceae cyanobacterium]